MEISSSSLAIASSTLRSPPSTFLHFLSHSPSPSRLKRLTSSSACAISITRESNSVPAPQRQHSKAYLARQAAILQVQQSPDFDSALKRYGGVLKVQDLNTILRYLGKLNRFQDLSKLFEWMQQHGEISASSYTSYIKLIGKSHNPLKALEIYSGISDQTIKVNVFICNAVLSCLVRNRKFDTSIKLFQQMKKDGLIPDVITYSTLLSGCMKVKNGYSNALELVNELDCSGLQMDGVIFGTILAVCASNHQCEEAEKYFQRMKDEGHTPNEFHYSSLLNAYSADGNYKKAEELVQDLKKTGLKPNKVILTTLLKVYVRGGLFEKSAELLAELESAGYADDEIAYCLVMDGLAKSGRIDEARSVFNAMTEKSVKSDGYAHSIMISAFCRGGLLDEAKLMARDFETKYNRYDLAILNAMLRAYCGAREMDSVMQTLRKLDELGISPDYNTFHILIKYFSKEKLYLLAFKTMEDMHSKGHQPEEELCSSLIFDLGKMNAHMEAFSIYKMLRYGKKTMCKALHEKILHILIAGRLYKEAYVVVKDNAGLISKPAMNKFAGNFMKSGNVNLINDVLKVVHASGNNIKKEIFHMGISRLIVVPQKKDLLIQLLQWMAAQGYAVQPTTREIILKNSQFLDGDLIKDILSKHKQISKAAAAAAALPKAKQKTPNAKRTSS